MNYVPTCKIWRQKHIEGRRVRKVSKNERWKGRDQGMRGESKEEKKNRKKEKEWEGRVGERGAAFPPLIKY